MVCIICKRSEEELRRSNFQEISDIDKVLAVIEEKINTEILSMNANNSKSDDKNSSNCMGEVGKYCRNCSNVESVDDKQYFWCKIYKKSFDITFPSNTLKQLKKDLSVIKLEREELEKDINLKVIEFGFSNTNEEHSKLMLTYMPDFSNQDLHLGIYLCEKCNSLLDKLIDNKISERIDDIVESVKDELEEQDEDDDEGKNSE